MSVKEKIIPGLRLDNWSTKYLKNLPRKTIMKITQTINAAFGLQ